MCNCLCKYEQEDGTCLVEGDLYPDDSACELSYLEDSRAERTEHEQIDNQQATE